MSAAKFTDDRFDNPTAGFRKRAWILLLALVLCAVASVVWAFVAELPVTVQSQGILMHPAGVTHVESRCAGSVKAVMAVRGRVVKEGDVILELDLPELASQLRKAETDLAMKIELDKEATHFESQKLADETKLVSLQRESQQKAIASIQLLIQKNQEINDANLLHQEQEIERVYSQSKDLLSQLNAQRQKKKLLLEKKLATVSEITLLDGKVLESTRQLSALEDRKNNMNVQRVDHHQLLMGLESKMMELTLVDSEMENRLQRTRMKNVADAFQRQCDIDTRKSLLMDLRKQHNEFRLVKATASGTVIELPLKKGEAVRIGETLGSIAKCSSADQPSRLNVVAFFPLSAGKQVKTSDEVFITPTTVKRERFGSILGRVTEVSPLPMSAEEAIHVVGNQEVLRPLLNQGGLLGVHADLETKKDGQLAWTSNNTPPLQTAGTMVSVRVVVERRRPISYVLPFLKRSVFGSDDTKGAKQVAQQ